MAQIEEEKKVADKEREEMLANFEKHKELERQQQEKIRKVCVYNPDQNPCIILSIMKILNY